MYLGLLSKSYTPVLGSSSEPPLQGAATVTIPVIVFHPIGHRDAIAQVLHPFRTISCLERVLHSLRKVLVEVTC
jgi:hypothetical protein